MKQKPLGRPLPPHFKHVIEQPFTVVLTWKQRILLAFGCKFVGRFICWTEHSPGKVHPLMEFSTDERGLTRSETHPTLQKP